ncbi:hypothetical protein AB1K54_02770 [Microbacterium sp. BWT-B31]|uniref:hypothetical protein n=1 Tax=Microbacterium sp. BWT-B31 TaxID=3232072 RepID=UPI003527973D
MVRVAAEKLTRRSEGRLLAQERPFRSTCGGVRVLDAEVLRVVQRNRVDSATEPGGVAFVSTVAGSTVGTADGACIRGCLELLANPCELYSQASDEMRRKLNQAIFTRIWVVDLERVDAEFTEPACELIEAQMRWQSLRRDETIPVSNPRPPTRTPRSKKDRGVSMSLSVHDGIVWSKRSWWT